MNTARWPLVGRVTELTQVAAAMDIAGAVEDDGELSAEDAFRVAVWRLESGAPSTPAC